MINSKDCLPVPGWSPFCLYSSLFLSPIDNFLNFPHWDFLKHILFQLAIPSVGLCDSFQVSCKCTATLQALDLKQNKEPLKPKCLAPGIYHMDFFPWKHVTPSSISPVSIAGILSWPFFFWSYLSVGVLRKGFQPVFLFLWICISLFSLEDHYIKKKMWQMAAED